ncbi:hypothetical protein DSAG12_03734 [Promethearchaeum syntrophicum]|uniref:Uncharacterized protein n=1 Tax=Promethearchaeum syntrophicum TaxID=2594042 RepID=A0A5B9DGP4_9ARCH|nr:hypothetical protein [Candidatus Prometheoarchaeum syntrophicum]
MEEEKNSEIDWKNTYDEQIQGVSPQNIEQKVHHPSFQENLQKTQSYKRKSIRKTIVIILVVLILAYALLVFISSQQPGIFLPAFIICLCLWPIGKSSKKKPYEYVYEKGEQRESNGKIHEAQPSYLPNTRYDQAYIPAYGIPGPTLKKSLDIAPSKTKIYKNFQAAAEYNTSWLNVETQTLNIDSDDEIILSHWTPLRISYKSSVWSSIRNFLMLIVYFGIYAIIQYFRLDRGTGKFDAASQALFFPIVPYVLVCYRSFEKFIKAVLISFIFMGTTMYLLLTFEIISGAGIPFLKYFLFLDEFIPGVVNYIQGATPVSGPLAEALFLLTLVFIFEFIVMILYSLIKTRPYVSMVVSRKAVFIRAKTKKSVWDIIVNIFWIILNPFNISQYKDVQNRIRYNKMTANEGRHHDYSKIEPKDISSLKKKKYQTNLFISLSFIPMLLGIFIGFSFQLIIGIIILGIGVLFLLNTIKKKDKYKIIINVYRSQVEGSWILSHKSDIFRFERVPPSIAKFFQPLSKI